MDPNLAQQYAALADRWAHGHDALTDGCALCQGEYAEAVQLSRQHPIQREQPTEIRVISHWIPGCETGRHNQPHPGQTCDEADEWIRFRDQVLGDLLRANWEQFTRAHQAAALAETAFAAALEGLPPQPPQYTDVQRALDILAPHLAWDHRYRR
ncbi:hypothetical protein ACIQXA_08560 [Streptomyces massasporeus]|uniref:hypothetical protein n=1 Tax=Streptomyces massasporeus TaxID=67324 RepID=UPI00381FF54E